MGSRSQPEPVQTLTNVSFNVDGKVDGRFANHNVFTFYRNWVDSDLEKLLRRHSLEVVGDISN
jgi:hypothetical protein